jgi:hypothetical protein
MGDIKVLKSYYDKSSCIRFLQKGEDFIRELTKQLINNEEVKSIDIEKNGVYTTYITVHTNLGSSELYSFYNDGIESRWNFIGYK